MDIRHILQDCLLLLLFLPFHQGLSIDEDYEDAASFGRCPWIRNKLKNGRVRYRYKGRVAKFLCDSGFELAGKRSSTCVRGQWSNPLPVCVARGCNRVPTIANGRVTEMYRGALLVYDCNPGYTLAGDSSIHCDGRRWNATPPSCAVSILDPETHCDFETNDLCGWTHDPIHDFDWRRNQFATPSGHVGTGPSFDHTFGENKAGYYLYIEASSPRKPNDVARLFSPVYPSEESGGCFIFWYHMYGTNTGGLRVYLKPESYVFNELSPKWQEIGDHGNEWLRGNISVPVFKENFQIVMEGVRGDGYMGDSAIDDVYLTKQDCESMENETDIHSEDSTDSCRGRCRGSDSVDACGCSENCHAADNCCSDYMSLCFEVNETLIPDTDESLPVKDVDFTSKSSSIAPVTAVISESSEVQTQSMTTKLSTESPNQFSTVVSSNTQSSATSSSNFPDSTISSALPLTSMSSAGGTVSSSLATTVIPNKPSTSEIKPDSVSSSSSSSSTVSVTNIAEKSLSSTTEKTTINYTSSAGATISVKVPLTTTSTQKNSPSTPIFLITPPSTTTTLNTTPSPTTSTTMSSLAATTEKITTQKTVASTMKVSTKSTSINSTPSQPLTSEVTSTQNSKDINQTVVYLTTKITTFPKLTFPDSTTLSTSTVVPSTSTPRYNLRPRKTTVLSTTVLNKDSMSTTSTFISTITSKTETSTVPVPFTTTIQSRRWFNFTRSPAFTSRIFSRKPTEAATTKSSNFQTNTVPNSLTTTSFRIPRPSLFTFPSPSPTTADSFEMVSSKSSDSSATVITVVIIILLCVVGGTVFYIKKYRGKRQSKLDDDSEMRFLPDSDYMEYSDASALDKIMVK